MSLLLDALKKAAEEKLEKESDNTQTEFEASSQNDADVDNPETEMDVEIEVDPSLRLEETTYEEDETVADFTQSPAKSVFTGSAEYTVTGADTDHESMDLTLADITDDDYRIETVTPTQQDYTAPEENIDEEDQTVYDTQDQQEDIKQSSDETVSLTKKFEAKNTGYSTFKGSPDSAAKVFISKGTIKTKGPNRSLIALLTISLVCVFGLYGYDYFLNSTTQIYSPPNKGVFVGGNIATGKENINKPQKANVSESDIVVNNEDYAEFLDKEIFVEEKKPISKKVKKSSNAKKPRIKIAKQSRQNKLQETLDNGYAAYVKSDYADAEILYLSALNIDENNKDALLGLSAIAMQQGKPQQAYQYYSRLLELNPKDPAAISGLASLEMQYGNQNKKLANESQIKLMLAEQPQSHELHFVLGNLYASELRWADAQRSYFEAYSNKNNNANYTYNLAISLDHLGKAQHALRFYQEAVKLSEEQEVSFSVDSIKRRIIDIEKIK